MRQRTRLLPSALLAVAALVTAVGCGDDEPSSAPTAGSSSLSGSITVSAAASLGDALTELADGFTSEHPDADVTFSFDSSSSLAAQIAAGAPADVFASADDVSMASLAGEGLVDADPTVFARNQLVIVTKPGNPDGVASLADLERVGVVSLCAEDAPCGRYAAAAFGAAGVDLPTPVTRGQNARATLTAVSEGDADAGVVYATDAAAVGDAVEAVPIPASGEPAAAYLIAVVAGTDEPEVAEAFVAHVVSDGARAVFEEHGFLPAG